MGIDPVAIIGMGLRAPGAGDVEQFWENLLEGRNSIDRLTEDELLAAGEDPALVADPDYVPARPLLADVGGFDHRFFGVSRREAELRNPQHRLFLELCSTALQHAGYDPGAYDGEIGVYGGAAYDRYGEDHVRADPALFDQVGEMVTNVSNNIDYLTAYVSYRLGLRGPSLAVRTACATSLVAVHLACQALRQGECDMALAGGVEIETPYGRGYLHVPGGIASHDGVCRPLDADASGTVFGSGGGIVLLKRLADALADGDTVYAVVRGSAIGNDGAEGVGFSAPSSAGQSRVISEALVVADVDPATVSYVELHGTGTSIGDPIEVHGLNEAFRAVAGRELAADSCAIGSLKSNIGHLGPASGVAGLIKTTLMLSRDTVAPTINVRTPNPALGLPTTPFRIADRVEPWPRREGTPRRAGVSSFGFGGTNAHVVLEEAPEPVPSQDFPRAELLVWSAVDDTAEAALRDRLAADLATPRGRSAADVAFTSQTGRAALSVRAAVRFTDVAAVPLDSAVRSDGVARQPVFMFPGQGSQRPGAGAGLAAAVPEFDRRLRTLLTGFGDLLGIDLLGVWQHETDQEVISRTVHAQPLLFAVEHALAETLADWGIRPAAVTGHSVGELVAATLAGVFDLSGAMRVVARRAELMQDLPPGRMLAVSGTEAEVRALLPDGVWVSAVNGANQVVVGGADLDAFAASLRDRGVESRPLRTSHAFHTPMMAGAVAELTEIVATCELREPQLPLVSAASGTRLDAARALSPRFWAEQLVEPVRFLDAMDVLAGMESSVLVEVGPGRALTGLARRHAALRAGGHRVVGTLVEGDGEWEGALDAVAATWVGGTDIAWTQLPRTAAPRRVPLPIYPYQREHLWLPDASARRTAVAVPARVPESSAEVVPAGPVVTVPGWSPASVVLPMAPAGAGVRGHAVVLTPQDQAAARYVATAVRLAGYRPVVVSEGERLDLRGTGGVTVRRGVPEDLVAVFAWLAERDVVPSIAVLATGVGAVPAGVAEDDPALVERGFGTGLGLLRVLAQVRRDSGRPVPLTVVTERAISVAGERPVPALALAVGLVRSAVREFGAGQVRMVDVSGVPAAVLATEIAASGGVAATEVAGGGRGVGVAASARRAAGQVTDIAGSGEDSVVALRGGRRWLPDHTPVAPDGPSPSFLSSGGVYVITGGLGGIGLAVARAIADTGVCPKLVLVGRRAREEELSADVRKELAGLEDAGATVRLAAGDVADAGRMAEVFAGVREEFGRVDGILHAAGVPGGGMGGGGLIATRSTVDALAVLAPKVTGSVVLRDIAAGLPELRFLVFFSSSSALLGVLGSADYAAANAFQDALALTCAEMNAKVLSVNWPSWLDTGMAADPAAPRVADSAGAVRWDSTLSHAAAYVDLLVRAVRERPGVDEFDAVVIEDLVVTTPLVGEETVTVWLAERPGGGWAADIESNVGGAPVRHASAVVSTSDETSEPITEGGDALELPEELTAEADLFAVHPALLAQALPELVSARRIVVLGDLPAQVVARVRPDGLDLGDTLGRRLLTVEGLAEPKRRRKEGRPAAISPDEGTTVLMRLLTESAPASVAVSPSDGRHEEPSAPPPPAAPAEQPVVNSESDIALLWAETLGHAEVLPEDDFFELGGDSLTAVQLVSRLRDRLGVTLSVVELLDQPTPRKLAAAVAAKASA